MVKTEKELCLNRKEVIVARVDCGIVTRSASSIIFSSKCKVVDVYKQSQMGSVVSEGDFVGIFGAVV